MIRVAHALVAIIAVAVVIFALMRPAPAHTCEVLVKNHLGQYVWISCWQHGKGFG